MREQKKSFCRQGNNEQNFSIRLFRFWLERAWETPSRCSLCANLNASNFVDQHSACHKHSGWCCKAQSSWAFCLPKPPDRNCLTPPNSTNGVKVWWSRTQSATNSWSIETQKHMYNFLFMTRSCAVPGLFSYATHLEFEFCKNWLFIFWFCKCNTSITCIAQSFPWTEGKKQRRNRPFFRSVCVFLSLLHDLMLLLSERIGAHIQHPTALRDFPKQTAPLYCSSASLHSWSRTWPRVSYSSPVSVCDRRHSSSALKGTVSAAMISFSFPAWHAYNGKSSRCKVLLAKKS